MIDKQEPTSTPTGRTPSAGPNMQGITFRTDEAAAIRAVLITAIAVLVVGSITSFISMSFTFPMLH